jgi:hypothetical protein
MTLKKTRELMARIFYHTRQLSDALNEAHSLDLIKYENFAEEAPCKMLYGLEQRVEATTKDQIAKAFISDLNAEYWQKKNNRRRKK